MPEAGQHAVDHARMEQALLRAVTAFDRAGLDYALMGGLASAAMGRDRHTHDVDLFVAPGDREEALAVLARAGFRTERTDPEWLYKAFWNDVLVDVIFVSKGGIVLDDEARRHRRGVDIRGRRVQALGPEDLLVVKALAPAWASWPASQWTGRTCCAGPVLMPAGWRACCSTRSPTASRSPPSRSASCSRRR